MAAAVLSAASWGLAGQPAGAGRPADAPEAINPGTLLSRAAAGLENLSALGVDRRVLVGVASVAERRAARSAGEAALEAIAQAERAIDERAALLERLAAARPDQSRTLLAQRAQMLEEERGVRAVLLRGRARLLLGALSDGPTRQAHLTGACDALGGLEVGATAGEALRRVSLAWALMMRGGEGDRARAAGLVAGVLEWPVGEHSERESPPAVTAEAIAVDWLLNRRDQPIASLRALLSRGPMAPSAEADPNLASLAVDVGVRLGVEGAGPDAAGLQRAIEPLVERARLASSPDERALAEERIEGALLDVPEANWPARGRLARGIAALARGEREQGLRVLDALAKDASAGPLAARAAWAAAEALLNEPDGRGRGEAIARLLESMPESERAAGLERALKETAAWRAMAKEAAPSVREAAASARARTLGRALERAQPTSPEADAWRLELVEMLGEGAVSGAAGERAMALGAGWIGAAGERAQRGRRAVEAVLDRWAAQSTGPARVEALQKSLAWWERVDPARARRTEQALGVAMLDAGQREGRVRLEAMEQRGELDTSAALRLAGAQREAGERMGAFTTLRRVADALDRDPTKPGEPKRPEAFWEAWARMLAMLEEDNADGSRTGEIRLRLRQLALIDPALGPGAIGERIRAVERRLKPVGGGGGG
jgi:hypothetical protein